MAKKQKLRAEIAEQYQWDLSDFYKQPEAFEHDVQQLITKAAAILNYRGIITKDAITLSKFLKDYHALSLLMEKIAVYTYLKKDEDCENNEHLQNQVRIANLITKMNTEQSFILPELLKTDYQVIKKYLTQEASLAPYAFVLAKIYRFADYILPTDKEELMTNFNSITDGFYKSFNFIVNSQIKYGSFIDENQQKVELNNSNYRKYIHSSSRAVRKRVTTLYRKQYQAYNLCLSENLIGCYKSENLEAITRGYQSALAESLYKNDLDPQIYYNLINTVDNKLKVLTKYYQLLKTQLKVKTLTDYDLNANLVSSLDKDYPYETAQKIITEALGVLGKDYGNIINKAFKERWIDVYHNKGKASGFYCMPNYSAKPVILANYENKLDDVSALAHELGHAINCYYSVLNNPYQYYDHSIFLAEVASLTNEIIMAHYLLNKSKDKQEKLYIISNLLNLYYSNLFKATMGADFEVQLHEKLQNNETVTNETINNIWLNLLQKFYQKQVKISPNAQYGWSAVPHFYYNYYYYQYATGISMATYIAHKIMAQDQEMLTKYLAFLTKGGSDYPLNLIKELGLDMTKPQIIDEAITAFSDLIDLFDTIENS